MTVFAVNRDMEDDFLLNIDLRSFDGLKRVKRIVLHHDDVKAVNTEENPDNVSPATLPEQALTDGRLEIALPRLSWNVIRVTP